MSLGELKDEKLRSIGFACSALSPFFVYEPHDEALGALIEAFKSLDVESAASEWPFGEPDEVLEGLQLVSAGAGASLEQLTWEFRRLFVGPGHKAAPPWGSVYTDHDCVIFGESALALRRWMDKNGIVRKDDGQPDDHMGLMLDLTSWLAENRPDLLEEYLQEHLLTWSSHYLDILEDAAQAELYKGLAVLTRATLEGIERDLQLHVEHPRFYR